MSQSTVLVVEDDLALQEALSDTLELAGYDVAVATTKARPLPPLTLVPM